MKISDSFETGAARLAALMILTILSVPFSSAAQPHESEHDEVVQLGPTEREEFGIVVAAAGPGTIEQYLNLPGEIHPNDNRLAHIVPRFAGIATEVRAGIGDRVEVGQVLAVIESDESLAPYEMKTLLAGTVIDKHLTLGEAVSREHTTFVIADLSSVRVDITVYQRDLTCVAVGQQALISSGPGLPEVTAEISYITPIVNEITRTAVARVVIPNPAGIWRPGMFIMARILLNSSEVPVAVPLTALQVLHGQEVVFVETAEGFRPRPVTQGRAGVDSVEIVAGLVPGEMYVTQGGFTLKAELGKESFDVHGH